jgi:hypothetical protein
MDRRNEMKKVKRYGNKIDIVYVLWNGDINNPSSPMMTIMDRFWRNLRLDQIVSIFNKQDLSELSPSTLFVDKINNFNRNTIIKAVESGWSIDGIENLNKYIGVQL